MQLKNGTLSQFLQTVRPYKYDKIKKKYVTLYFYCKKYYIMPGNKKKEPNLSLNFLVNYLFKINRFVTVL